MGPGPSSARDPAVPGRARTRPLYNGGVNDLAAASGVEVRPAATVMLVRDAPGPSGAGLEVLMLRRHLDSVFAAGAWVFPGGRVDDADRDVPLPGPTDAEASAVLGLPSGGLAFWAAAARECFEEAGILLARTPDGGWARPTDDLDAARFERHRRDVHAGRRTLADVLAGEGLVLDVSGLHYVSRWITPPGASRRFDTRFFVAAAPDGQVASHDSRETVASVWTTPQLALDRHAAGEIDLVFPTIKNLEMLGRHGSRDVLLAAARSIGRVPVVAPRFPRDHAAVAAAHREPPCPT